MRSCSCAFEKLRKDVVRGSVPRFPTRFYCNNRLDNKGNKLIKLRKAKQTNQNQIFSSVSHCDNILLDLFTNRIFDSIIHIQIKKFIFKNTRRELVSPLVLPLFPPLVSPFFSLLVSPTRFPILFPTRFPTRFPTLSPTRFPTRFYCNNRLDNKGHKLIKLRKAKQTNLNQIFSS